jgi:hypothetical protein
MLHLKRVASVHLKLLESIFHNYWDSFRKVRFTFQRCDPSLGVDLSRLHLKNFVVSNQSFFGLLAFLVQDAKIIPNFVELRFLSGRLDYGLKWLCVIALLVEQNGKTCPEDGVCGWFQSSLLKTVKCLTVLLKYEKTSSFYVQGVYVAFVAVFCFWDVVQSTVDLRILEVAPG